MRKIPAGAGNRGFTLLEMAVALAVMALLTTAAVPFFIRLIEITAAQKTAKEISTIQEATKWYYINNKAWPGSIGALQSAGLLNSSCSLANPWGNAYSISSSSTGFALSTAVPETVSGVVARALPGVSTWTNGYWRGLSSVIPVPGQEASLTSVTNLANNALNTANSAMSMAQSSAVPPYDASFVDAVVPCPGSCAEVICPSGYVMVGVYHGDGYQNYLRGALCSRITR